MSQQTTQTTPAEAVEQVLDAIRAMDLDALKAVVHPDVEVIEPAGLPYGGVYRGADAFFGDLFPAIAGPFELGVANSKVFEQRGAAAVRMDITFTSRRTGEAIVMPYVEIYHVAEGLITKIDVFPQDVTALTQFMDANR
jgi:uncharacterized protein